VELASCLSDEWTCFWSICRGYAGEESVVRDTREYTVYPSELNILESFKNLTEYLSACGYEEIPDTECPETYTLQVDPSRTLEARSLAGFIDLLRRFPASMPITLHTHLRNKNLEYLVCVVSVRQSGIGVMADAVDPNQVEGIHGRIKEFFQASNPWEQERRSVSRYDLKKSVFLAHRFDSPGNDISSRLATFLRRLGFEVLEGSGYETQGIPDKVMGKIKSQDIFICVVTSGDASWILSEASVAKARNKYLILLCQRGVSFNKGIIGQDHEYLEFPGDDIEKVYSELLYALPPVK